MDNKFNGDTIIIEDIEESKLDRIDMNRVNIIINENDFVIPLVA